jgi:hypothetical protein
LQCLGLRDEERESVGGRVVILDFGREVISLTHLGFIHVITTTTHSREGERGGGKGEERREEVLSKTRL